MQRICRQMRCLSRLRGWRTDRKRGFKFVTMKRMDEIKKAYQQYCYDLRKDLKYTHDKKEIPSKQLL